MNENFINTWIANSELGRIQSLREPIAKRREREGKTFDTTHPLAQAIIKGWKTGTKKGSPVDCFVLSHKFELMGRQLVNDLGEDSNHRGLSEPEYYLTFLKEAVEGKEPGLGKIVLTHKHASQRVVELFRTPIDCYQDYTVVTIDATAFENGGTLTIDLEVGKEDCDGTFYLINDDTEFSTTTVGIPKKDLLTSAWAASGETGQIAHRFDRGQRFKLGAIGYSYENETCVNAFRAKISVLDNQQEESSEREHLESSKASPETSLNVLNVVLDRAQPSQEILDVFRAPGEGYQDYTVANIDTTAFEEGGTLIIDVRVGSADISGSFDLFDGDAELSTEGYPTGALASMWGIRSSEAGKIRHHFTRGKIFKFGATGDWSGEKGRINAFSAKISVEPAG